MDSRDRQNAILELFSAYITFIERGKYFQEKIAHNE